MRVESGAKRNDRVLGERVALIDISGGVSGVTAGIEAGCDTLGVDLVGTDSGGDVLGRGNEPSLSSPLTDALMLAVLSKLNVESCLGVFDYGSDGELTAAELSDGIAWAAERDGLLGVWGLTPLRGRRTRRPT